MATNQFKPFATASGANVLSQAEYEAIAALATGFQSGVASSAQLNKAWRQATTMAAVLGQLIVDETDLDALDDGNIATLKDRLKAAITASIGALGTMSSQNADNVNIIGGNITGLTVLGFANPTAQATARNNMGLGSAAVKNAGTSGDAVPVLNAENTWGSDQILNNGTSDSPAMCWQIPSLVMRSDLLVLGGKTIFRIWWNTGSAGEIAAEYNITDATAKIFGQDVYTKGNVSSFAQTLLDDADAPTARGTLGAISSADVPGIVAGFGYNTLGSHVLARLNTGTGTGSVPFQPGTTVSGANLIPDNCAGDETGLSGGALTGTWMLKGFIYNADAVTDPDSISLFLKVAN
ncbi:hypothetical protein SAMN04244579_02730 [Azotobacter beijerinckii]|uniref:Phage tail fibre repeat-containing protein n=1 Tax=Azotobacter beijerinckii TaxID=170623 RepID=A0A1H6VEY7_9GAMM|nr:hypothetical protein [Azotobacter beijerinckii]SEI99200.1 hypothetical protein SAMN04244579_02730 [Azotobacter beijerinckii]